MTEEKCRLSYLAFLPDINKNVRKYRTQYDINLVHNSIHIYLFLYLDPNVVTNFSQYCPKSNFSPVSRHIKNIFSLLINSAVCLWNINIVKFGWGKNHRNLGSIHHFSLIYFQGSKILTRHKRLEGWALSFTAKSLSTTGAKCGVGQPLKMLRQENAIFCKYFIRVQLFNLKWLIFIFQTDQKC